MVENANAAFVYIAAETTFRHQEPQRIALSHLYKAKASGYDNLRTAHIEDYRSLYSRVTFQLGSKSEHVGMRATTTDRRIEQLRAGNSDDSLITLYYQFGRYLLISSSRPGNKPLPANLQGIWNGEMHPPWGSKFTININTEMNYWPAETTNLSECHEPFLLFLERLKEKGKHTASQMYGCRGWTAHHNSDIWADTAPQDRVINSTLWPMGGAWVSTHIMEHFAFTGDNEFLAGAYHILRDSVEFFIDFLIERDGYFVTSPSLSPENNYLLPSGEQGSLCIGPTMDSQVLFQLFSDFLKASTILQKDVEEAEMIATVTRMRERLPPMRIGKYGQLQEWQHDYEEAEPGHRHTSHLWGLFPGQAITHRDPELTAACKKTIFRRVQSGGGHTGWSRAWLIAFWARLRDGEEALRQVHEILRSSTYDSLLDAHPPFQIDGNFGATAAITEMLVQSHGQEVFILPTLPKSWPDGMIKGIRARGGFEVSLEWECGHLTLGTIVSLLGNICTLNSHYPMAVRDGNCELIAKLEEGNAGAVSFSTEKGKAYFLTRSA